MLVFNISTDCGAVDIGITKVFYKEYPYFFAKIWFNEIIYITLHHYQNICNISLISCPIAIVDCVFVQKSSLTNGKIYTFLPINL